MQMHLVLLSFSVLAGAAPADFNQQWGDWKAELDSYRLAQPRYGQPRPGSAVMIWVTEPLSAAKHVKLDRPEAAGADAVSVMKLNFIRRFKTGIYDYSLMTSVFSPVVFGNSSIAAHRPLKVTFTGQDWCGHVFQQLDIRGGELLSQWRSYFESEGDAAERLPLAENLLLEDELWYRLRGLTEPLAPGVYPLAPAPQSVRLSHSTMVLGTVRVARAPRPVPIKVPAGAFDTVQWELTLRWGPDGRQQQRRTVWIEEAAPHRIVAWEGDVPSFHANEPSRERAELKASIRDTYWQHNRLEDDALRSKLLIPD